MSLFTSMVRAPSPAQKFQYISVPFGNLGLSAGFTKDDQFCRKDSEIEGRFVLSGESFKISPDELVHILICGDTPSS